MSTYDNNSSSRISTSHPKSVEQLQMNHHLDGNFAGISMITDGNEYIVVDGNHRFAQLTQQPIFDPIPAFCATLNGPDFQAWLRDPFFANRRVVSQLSIVVKSGLPYERD